MDSEENLRMFLLELRESNRAGQLEILATSGRDVGKRMRYLMLSELEVKKAERL